jgi:RNA polymerase sigma-70 factor (ECF subfamily)
VGTVVARNDYAERAELGARASEAALEAARIERAQRGDAAAFAELYDQHLDRVFRNVLYRVGDRAEAEDLTQQVFVRAWQALGRYRVTGAPFVAWLLTIAHNLVVDHYKARREVTPLDDQVELPSREQDPMDQVIAGLRRDELRCALLTLRPDYQQVVALRFFEGFTPGEIAATMGKSEGNVRVMQHRALLELRGRLDREAI